MKKQVAKIRDKRYPGCWYVPSTDTRGSEDRIYYCRYKRDGKTRDAKHGRKSEGKTWTTCSTFRAYLIAGKKTSNQEKRQEKKAATVNHLSNIWEIFKAAKGRNGIIHSEQTSFSTTFIRYKKYIIPAFGADKDLSTITPEDLDKFQLSISTPTPEDLDKFQITTARMAQTVKHIIRLTKQLCAIAGNEVKHQLPTVKNQVTEDLTSSELASLKKVLASYPNRILADMLSLIMATGIRRGEALRLQVKHLDMKRGIIQLVDRKSSGKDMDTSIPMSSMAKTILKRRIKENMRLKGANDYIFPGNNGSKRFDSKRARSIMNEAGIPKSFRPCHGLRHYYATSLVDSDVPIHVVSRLLGHASISTTERYFVARQSALQEAVEVIAKQMEV